jgi:hypothetical protein
VGEADHATPVYHMSHGDAVKEVESVRSAGVVSVPSAHQ